MYSAIDKYIDTACDSGNQEDYANLFQLMKKTEVYFSLSENGEIQLYENSDSEESAPGIVCYSSVDDKRLTTNYTKMIWEDALKMVRDFSEEIMLILQSPSEAWVGISQETATTLLIENADNSDLHPLVQKAGTTQKDEDFYEFFMAVYNRYIFFPVEEDETRSIKIAKTQNDLSVIVFFLKPSDEYSCNATLWQDALRFVADNADIDGVIVQSNSKENIAISREKIEQLLNIYDEWNNQLAN